MHNEERKFLFEFIKFSWTAIPIIIIAGIGLGRIAKEYYPEKKQYQEIKIEKRETYYIDVTRDSISDKIVFNGKRIEVYKGLENGKFDLEDISNKVNLPKENSLERKF
jgi:hypothetical protein